MLAPEFVSVFFGLKPTTADAIKDIGYSSLKTINDVVLFPRTIAFSQGHIEESVSLKTKVFAWAYELSADIR
ncbi:trhR, partial [Salmonella enterica subsp. enterica serovar 1,4,[5],12:i:-]|nr:trhR [Salmonella enterica subsp. enterica serovar 1,4,[5],12:i:-]